MKKLYIVRHGKSEGSANGHVSFPHTPITDKGEKDALRLGKRLANEKTKIDAIFYSPLVRSTQTLEAIKRGGFDVTQIYIKPNVLLQEINRKEFEGKPREIYYAKKEASGLPPADYRCEGGESENDVKNRAKKFLMSIKNNKFDSILIITHGHFIAQFMSLLGFSNLSRQHGTSLSLLKIDNNKAKIIFWNNISHLS